MGAQRLRWVAAALARAGTLAVTGTMAVAGLALSGPANADPDPPPLPVFTPGPTDWAPNFEIWPYSTFTYQVTPEMISGMSDACQWFNAQYDPLMGQIHAFNRRLGDEHDDYSVGGLQQQANGVVANIDRSTAFLLPRVQPLIITNTPNNFGPYSPIYGGEPITSVTFQLTRISDSIKKEEPSGVTHANIVSAAEWGNALRAQGACN